MTQKEQKWLVLLYTLTELNGGTQRSIVLNHINDSNYWYKNDENDILLSTRNEFVWRNDFSFERQHLVEEEYMKSNSNGKWKITDKGRRLLLHLIEKAKKQSNSTIYYTSSFFKKIINDNMILEIEEDQILLNALSQSNNESNETVYILNNMPQPIDYSLNRATSRKTYPRSPAVSQRALNRANNLCEIDHNHVSFIRRNGNVMYMEPHHLIPMSLTGFFGVNLDREQNIFSLCSNCHNQIHYGTKDDVRNLISKLFLSRQNEICSILGRNITLEEIYKIYE